jgi:hypothetical protein
MSYKASAKILDVFSNAKYGGRSEPPVSGVGPTGRHYARVRGRPGEREEREVTDGPYYFNYPNTVITHKQKKPN